MFDASMKHALGALKDMVTQVKSGLNKSTRCVTGSKDMTTSRFSFSSVVAWFLLIARKPAVDHTWSVDGVA